MLANHICSSEQYEMFASKAMREDMKAQAQEKAPDPSTPSRMQRFRTALDRSRNGSNRGGGIMGALNRSRNGVLNRSRNGGLDRSRNGLDDSRNGMDNSRNGLNRSRNGLELGDGEEEKKRKQRFGKYQNMWEEKGLKNTPGGITPEKLSHRKPITKDDDRMPPSAHCMSQGGDIIIRKGCIGNTSLLKATPKGAPPEEDMMKLAEFPDKISVEVIAKVLEKQKELGGKPFPDCVAFTLWATDNMNIYGKSMAQIFGLLGVRLIKGSVDDLELIPLEELKRPRVDVVVSCSGVFRDLFMNQMSLIDRAVKMTAEAKEPPEMNFVRKHSFQLTQEIGNISLREAATRVFSNAAGSYSANIAAWVKSNEWESEIQLQRQFLARKCYTFNADKPGFMEYRSELFRAVLRSCEVVIQNLDLNEILSITDVPHYYDADPTNVIQALRFDGKKPICLLAQVSKNQMEVKVHTLSEIIRIDSMSKILSPDYFEKILNLNDNNGVREISNCMRNILGWAVTSGEVDTFIFEIAYNLFMEDPAMQLRLREMDNTSFGNLVATFVKAGERHYWETSDTKIRRLRELKKYAESELD